MQSRSISDDYPNVISITRVREDIDALTKLLEKYRQVRVLRGQEILFNAVRPETEEEKQQKIRTAVATINQIRNSFKFKRGNKKLSDIVIKERDKILERKNL